MIRVVLDTNIIVSAYLNENGHPFRILKMALAGLISLYASEAVLAEYKELLLRKSFPLSSRRAAVLYKRIREASTIVRPSHRLAACSDPDDDIFLECAEAAKARYLVTGNTRHFPKSWTYTQIVTAKIFLTIWQAQYPHRPSV